MIAALERGYVIHRIYSVWHWEDKSDELFSSYINTFLKEKVEASKIPSGIDRNDLVAGYRERENIILCVEKLMENEGNDNPGRRMIAKLFLNSLWVNDCLMKSFSDPSLLYFRANFVKIPSTVIQGTVVIKRSC